MIRQKTGSLINEGTYGKIYTCRSPNNHEYAIKRNLVETQTSFVGSVKELDLLNKLRHHPHIVKLQKVVFGDPFVNDPFSPLIGPDRFSQKNDMVHFVYDKADYDLHKFIYGALSVNFALIKKYMVQILLGVEYMHSQGIIHRDLKPSNVLIFGYDNDALNNINVVKICDFGLAKPYTFQGQQTPHTVTSLYRAPEIALDYPHYDYRIDIWAVGCIFFEMVAKRSFIINVSDSNNAILSAILGALPVELSLKKMRELVKSNKWRKVNLTKMAEPKLRRTFYDQLNLNAAGVQSFNTDAGNVHEFIDLLNNMILFDWDKRYNAKQCLDHRFFADYQKLIEVTRKDYPIVKPKEEIMLVRKCIERKWMANSAIEIFNNRHKLNWYNHRALFQAMDLYDRYLAVMFHHAVVPDNFIESDLKGLIHDKFGAELRFMTCIYLCIKFFSSMYLPITYDSVVTHQYKTKEAKIIAEQFEASFIYNCLEYNIYRPTLYEMADDFNDKLDDTLIRDLLIVYCHNDSFSGLTPNELYNYYRNKLKALSLPELLSVIKTLKIDKNDKSSKLILPLAPFPALHLSISLPPIISSSTSLPTSLPTSLSALPSNLGPTRPLPISLPSNLGPTGPLPTSLPTSLQNSLPNSLPPPMNKLPGLQPPPLNKIASLTSRIPSLSNKIPILPSNFDPVGSLPPMNISNSLIKH